MYMYMGLLTMDVYSLASLNETLYMHIGLMVELLLI